MDADRGRRRERRSLGERSGAAAGRERVEHCYRGRRGVRYWLLVGRFLRTFLVLAGLGLPAPPSAGADLSLQLVGGAFSRPTYVTSDPSDSGRLFVVEQDGRIQLVEGGDTSLFLDINEIVRSPVDTGGGNEQGLLSMAFSPDYATSGRFYVFYTAQENGAGELTIDEFDADGAPIESTRRPVIGIPHAGTAQNHNGGQLQFGPDDLLYASTGDGGSGGAPNAQNLGSLLGKIIRIDPEASGPSSYTVPATNPFVGVDGADEIWSYGLRNPWRFSFDRSTGALLVADVGQNTWEEVNYEPIAAGAGRADNFGWRCREGMHPFVSTGECAGVPPAAFTDPVFEYSHDGGNCSVTGGYLVRDQTLGDLDGRYLYADLCAGDLRSLCPALPVASGDRSEGIALSQPTSFGEDSAGRVYVVERGGTVSRITGTANVGACSQPPPAPGPPGEPGPPADATPPRLELSARNRHHLGSSRVLKVRASADEPARAELDADVRPDHKDRFKLGGKAVDLPAGAEERVKWKLSRREARRAKRRLRRGKKLAVRIKGRATDAAGNASEREALKIRLGR